MKEADKKPLIIKILLVATGVLLVGTIGFFVWRKAELTRENNRLETEKTKTRTEEKSPTEQENTETPTTTPAPAPTPTPASDSVFKPSAAMINNITAILNTMDTQPFEGYVAGEVKLYYASNDPATTLTDRTQIAKSLEYFSDAKIPWDLRLSDQVITRYKSKFDKLFGEDCLTGSSADAGHVVSFCFNKDGKVRSIFLCRDPRVFN